jgi:KDO2-lipid IV(A) lauroyltransferase
VIGFARREAYGFRFRIDVQDIIRPADWAQQRDPLRYITQRYTKAIEDTVRGDPGQYLWLHRRWKSVPRQRTGSGPVPAVQPEPADPATTSADVAA